MYKPFYDRDLASVSKWAKWRNDGIKQMNGETCPFCADELKEEIEKQNKVISKVFKNSALSTANAVLEYLREAVEKIILKLMRFLHLKNTLVVLEKKILWNQSCRILR